MNPQRVRARALGPDTNYPQYVEQIHEVARQTQNRRNLMRYRTKRGDNVEMPNRTDALRKKATDVYTEAVAAFDEIQEAARREAAINRPGSADGRRFPVLNKEA
jgi:hypothetical protein